MHYKKIITIKENNMEKTLVSTVDMDIKKFDTLKESVKTLVKNIEASVVSLPKGDTGYKLMRENKQKLVAKRRKLKMLFKNERAWALAYQKDIIAIEKDILGIMAPSEEKLSNEIEKIDKQKLIEKRKGELPSRKDKLRLIKVIASDSQLLEMDDIEFLQFFNEQRELYLDKKEQEQLQKEKEAREKAEKIEEERLAKIREEEEARAAKQQKEEEARVAKQQKEEEARVAKQQKEEEARVAIIDAENKKIAEEKEAIRLEKKKIEDAQRAKEDEEKRVKEIEVAKEKAAKEEAERIERDRIAKKEREDREQKEMEEKANYQDFLREYKYDESNHIIKREGKNVKLYKLVAEINL